MLCLVVLLLMLVGVMMHQCAGILVFHHVLQLWKVCRWRRSTSAGVEKGVQTPEG